MYSTLLIYSTPLCDIVYYRYGHIEYNIDYNIDHNIDYHIGLPIKHNVGDIIIYRCPGICVPGPRRSSAVARSIA
jgi:hypothetical protein